MSAAFITPSPIPVRANLSIFVDAPTTGYTVDPDTGNQVPQSRTIELKAAVVRSSEAENQSRQPGGKFESIELRGFILDGIVKQPVAGTYRAILRGRTTAEDQRGEFDVLPLATPFLSEINQSIGLPITGFFRRLE